jgi:hypothetical protein
MSNHMEFLARWSHRKRHATIDKNTQSKSGSSPDNIVSEASAAPAQDETRLPFDDASLPKLESIGAESDIRAFLEAGVPGDLARAALRRVWSSDPAIRDFIGLSENSGDFNAPGAMAGFGPIDREEAGRILTRLFGEGPDTMAAAVHPPVISPGAEDSQKPAGESDPVEYQSINAESAASGQQLDVDKIRVAGEVAQQGGAIAPQSGLDKSECLSPILRRRGHGGASPRLPSGKAADNANNSE